MAHTTVNGEVINLAEVVEKNRKYWKGETGGERADLSGAHLSGADLRSADLSGANLRRANLSGANLSGAMGLTDAIDYLNAKFDRDVQGRGLIAYKTFGSNYIAPDRWKREPGAILTEVALFDRCTDCGCGVNVATRDWINRYGGAGLDIWRVLIRWEWLVGVVVPYHTDGKIRASRVELLEIVTD